MTLLLCSYANQSNRRLKRIKNGGVEWPVCLLGVRAGMEGAVDWCINDADEVAPTV